MSSTEPLGPHPLTLTFTVYRLDTGRIVSVGYGGSPVIEEGESWIAGEHDARAVRIVDGAPVPLEADPAADALALEERRDEARLYLCRWLDSRGLSITGLVPKSEEQTWDAKEAAAERIQRGTHEPKDRLLVAIEAAVVGEDPALTVSKIATNAAQFRVAGPLIGAVRRRAFRELGTAGTPEAIEAVLGRAQALFGAALMDASAFIQDPYAWVAAWEAGQSEPF